MTEDEAKTKICCGPLVTASVIVNVDSIRASGEMGAQLRCVGSACMAWRWASIEEAAEGEPHILAKDHPNADPRYVGGTRKLRPARGFCGLAGRPA